MSTADWRARGARLPSVAVLRVQGLLRVQAVLLVQAELRVQAHFICVLCHFKKPSGAPASHDSSLVTIQTERDGKASPTSTRVSGRCDDRCPLRRCQRTKPEAGNGVKVPVPGRTRLAAAFNEPLGGDKVGSWRGTKFPSGAASSLGFPAGLR